jgi:Zn-dependent protease
MITEVPTALDALTAKGVPYPTGATPTPKLPPTATFPPIPTPPQTCRAPEFVDVDAVSLSVAGSAGADISLKIAATAITLAVMNVLPIPALDGGRLFVTALFRVMKKKLTIKTEERIHGTGFAFLMTLFVVISVVDVRRFF